MKITTITVGINRSRQLPDGTWKKVEMSQQHDLFIMLRLGAGAEVDHATAQNLLKIWAEEPTAPPPINDDAPYFDPATEPSASRRPAAPPPPQKDPVCPAHGAAKLSHYGGLYCPNRIDEETFCAWTFGKPTRKIVDATFIKGHAMLTTLRPASPVTGRTCGTG